MNISNSIRNAFALVILLLIATPSYAQSYIYTLIQLHKNNAHAYAHLDVSYFPAKDPKSQTTPAMQRYLVDINLHKPATFDMLALTDKKTSLTVGASNGKVVWKDTRTGLSGSGDYDKVIDVALRDLLSGKFDISSRYKLSQYVLPKSQQRPVEIGVVTLRPIQFGTSIRKIRVFINAGKIVGMDADYHDGSRVFAAVKQLKLEP